MNVVEQLKRDIAECEAQKLDVMFTPLTLARSILAELAALSAVAEKAAKVCELSPQRASLDVLDALDYARAMVFLHASLQSELSALAAMRGE